MKEPVKPFDAQEPNAFRLLEGEKKHHFVELTFPGLEGTVVPTLEFFRNTIIHAIEKDLREKMIDYLDGVIMALPRRKKSLKTIDFRDSKWRKNSRFQQKCRKLNLVFPHSPQEVHAVWYGRATRSVRVPGEEKKYQTKVVGEKLKRDLSEEEKESLKKTKKFLEMYKEILVKYEARRDAELESRKEALRIQIETLGIELEKRRKEYTADLSRTRQEYEDLMRKKREMILTVVAELESERNKKIKELEEADTKKILEGKLDAVWAKMRIDGELSEW